MHLLVLLVIRGSSRGHAGPDLLLQHADQAEQLRPFYLFGVEVVRFGYVEVAHDVLHAVLLEHLFI